MSSALAANSSGPFPAGAGIGLRSVHHAALLAERPRVGWIEVHTENYFHDGGPHVRALERARELYPVSLHGVGLGLASADPLDRTHVACICRAIERYEPALVSEHACWGAHGGEHFNDLLPYDLKNTDGVTGQPETVCKVRITKLDDWPQFLKDGGSVYELVDEIALPGKGRKH